MGGAVLVTGATGGLGAAVVTRLLADGHALAIPYRDRNAFARLEAAVAGARLFGSPADAADPAAMAAFVEQAAARFGGLSGLAALAGGFAASGPLGEAPPAEWDSMMRLNLDTARVSALAALPHLRRERGSIVTMASRLVESGGAGAASYTVAKAGVVALTRALAAENGAAGVRANCILPGVVDTPANRQAMPAADTRSWTAPAAIADVVSFLLSPASRAVSGASLPLVGTATGTQIDK